MITRSQPGLELPEPNDRHVLAAAIRCHAQVIVTANLRDFPPERLDPYDIEAQSPDDFIVNIIDLAPARVVSVVQEQAGALNNPATTVDELLERLRNVGITRSIAAIRQHRGS